MSVVFSKFNVLPENIGLLYHNNQFQKELDPGVYRFFNPIFFKSKSVYTFPTHELWTNVTNQEVLSKDNIAFRFSYSLAFTITKPKTFIEKSGPTDPVNIMFGSTSTEYHQKAEEIVHTYSQVALREILSTLESNEINEKRAELFKGSEKTIQKDLNSYGITVKKILLRDVTFPKKIQDLFSLELEAKIRARSDLENARTRVAAARALKNAGEIMKNNSGVQYLQYLETISKISSNGKHTFVIGDSVNNQLKS